MKQIWAVGGGKGGVGKSFFTSNLGVMLAQKGYRVVLADMDLGGANLHTWLGVNNPERGLSEFVAHQVERIDQLLLPTTIPRLKLISGARDGVEIANLKHTQKLRFIRALKQLQTDYVLLDLGAGTAYNTIDFFLLADTQLLVVVPEPTSIENAYRFIKNSFYRQLRNNSDTAGLRHLVDEMLRVGNPYGIRTPKELIAHLRQRGGEFSRFIDEQVDAFRPKMILNQVRHQNDTRIGNAMENACQKYFGLKLQFIGHIEHDEVVWQSVLQRRPVLLDHPGSNAAKRLMAVGGAIIGKPLTRERHSESMVLP